MDTPQTLQNYIFIPTAFQATLWKSHRALKECQEGCQLYRTHLNPLSFLKTIISLRHLSENLTTFTSPSHLSCNFIIIINSRSMHLQQIWTLQELIHGTWFTKFYGRDHKLSTNLTTTRKFCEKVP
jgi:hypothetical protein